MARNRFTPTVRQVERARAAHLEASLPALARELHGDHPPVAHMPLVNDEKARRATRRELTALHRPIRAAAVVSS
ncbi:hypothetical protein AMES_2108 [Amycolatopsis mediterranei S699]|uniref:Uncharacterized protein n=2 Tax=Amycolatopsis mediterranei TaxID=33910 RepID=A0A0H3D313_AMYMU|nr:hypothetical protein [Amycolatopsis mediterranei]ADJ43931.1 hypothetical protein AMED_2126 [Amycolatopsis mediterranei U32]AEK40652.1 hypothetical protein RAM_10810 [Amycolatopsis mediterranei S699]AFO75644.1 hypothetical protein AMES_2108 [Amycolatopsis mediterranei S699]AGT82773.1 hypothetical protein B737_2109 [Amycolatopsis mediterranei RB]KDO04274.1 hypothetical protein DV26_44820 [Amycolatopsis mediterranei]